MKRIVVVGCVALGTAALVAASPRGARAEPKAYYGGSVRPLFVTSARPARNQHMLPDLSDPGANGQITVTFSTSVDPYDVVSVAGGLGAKCEFHDQTLAEVPVSASAYRNVLSLSPFSAARPVLPQGRYTLTLRSTVRSTSGVRLNGGARAFTTTFYVGSETRFAPVLLHAAPTAWKTGVALRRAIVATFDEPIDATSTLAAVRLEDRSAVPPTQIPIRVRTARRGSAVIVTPAPGTSYPRGTELTLVIAGEGAATDPSASVLTETEGHKFTRDRGPSWLVDASTPTLFHSINGDFDDVTGEFTLNFRTRGGAAVVTNVHADGR
jgi:hypothetical protein